MNTIDELDKNDCCGCSACAQKCPKDAIKMVENEEGFLYPVIDKEKCIDCGICKKVCPQLNDLKKLTDGCPKAYAMRNKNEEELMKSSSGGIFSVIANYVLENDGVVFGAAYDDFLNVNHIKIKEYEDLEKLRKSKYIQSNINNMFKETEIELKSGKMVLFTGTPCQIDGLKRYLGKEYNNLFTCDLVCHGVPSQKAFHVYLKMLENKSKNVVKFDFRTKDKPEYEKLAKVEFSDKTKKYLKIGLDCFYNNFLIGTLFRESCYKCKYANLNRVADITIGDFIGVNEVQSDIYNKNGISICIINTKKGEMIFEKMNSNVIVYETTFDKIRKYNMNLNKSIDRPKARNVIYMNIDNTKMFVKDLKKYMSKKLMLKSLIPVSIKKRLKRIRR